MGQALAKLVGLKIAARGEKLFEGHMHQGFIRINKCHDFDWSRKLWWDSAVRTAKMAFCLVIMYLVLGVYMLGHLDRLKPVNCVYFLSITLTTVGLGDFYPTSQVTRALGIFLLPMGLVVISFAISMVVAFANSKKKKLPSELRREEEAAMRSRQEQSKPETSLDHLSDFVHVTGKALSYAIHRTTVGRALSLFGQYALLILLGAYVFYWDEAEQRAQEANGVPRTHTNALFFATVVATTVGYGARIYCLTDRMKLLYSAYAFVASYKTAEIIGDVANLYLSYQEEKINETVINSTTYVHKSDLDGSGTISEAEYVLFKLQQLQKLDVGMMHRLIARFAELDIEKEGFLDIGIDIPDSTQAQRAIDLGQATNLVPQEVWEVYEQPAVKKELLERRASSASKDGPGELAPKKKEARALLDDENVKNLANCHDFKWSNYLWKRTAIQTLYASWAMAVLYFLIMYWVVHYDHPDLSVLDGIYYVTATITTVGYGDIAPKDHRARFSSVFLIPFGLTILGFFFSFSSALARSKPMVGKGGVRKSRGKTGSSIENRWRNQRARKAGRSDHAKMNKAKPKLRARLQEAHAMQSFKQAGATAAEEEEEPKSRQRGTRSKSSLDRGASCAQSLDRLPALEAFEPAFEKGVAFGTENPLALFESDKSEGIDGGEGWGETVEEDDDEEDDDEEGKEEEKGKTGIWETARSNWGDFLETQAGQCTILLGKLLAVLTLGALLMRLDIFPEERKNPMTWVDAFYFASVTATSIGYGDIKPLTDYGRGVMIFYMIFSTVFVAGILGDIVSIYLEYENELINTKIIRSTIRVYKADVDKDGKCSEAEFVLFKLQQMQKLDEVMLDRVIDKFVELDLGGEGKLDIGVDIPSATQAEELLQQQRRLRENGAWKKAGHAKPPTLHDLWLDMQKEIRKDPEFCQRPRSKPESEHKGAE